jgi:hypothetical protein
MDELWGGGGPDPLNPPLLSTPLLLYTTLAETKHFDTGATAQVEHSLNLKVDSVRLKFVINASLLVCYS